MKSRIAFLTVSLAFAGLLLALGLALSASTASASTPSADCVFAPVADWGNGKVVVQKWDSAPSGVACLTLVWEKQGSILMAGGVFTAPLTLNGSVLPTQMVKGQLAPQIVQFRRTVVAGEKWEFRPTWLATGTELVLGFDYEAPTATATPTKTPTPTHTATVTQTPTPTTTVAPVLWPCEGGTVVPIETDIDRYLDLNPNMAGQLAYSESWQGACPAYALQSVAPVPYSGKYRLRIAANEVLGTFYTTTDYNRALGYQPKDVSENFALYVPDALVEEFRSRGLDPTPFSDVTDWSLMLGAGSSDTVAQWVTKNPVELGGIYHNRIWLAFGMLSGSPNPAGVYVAWVDTSPWNATPTPTPTPKRWAVYLPLVVRPLPVLEEVREVRSSSELQVVYHKWDQAVAEQQTCMKINFVGDASHDALIESGWIFGSGVSAKLNGEVLAIPTYTRPGDTALQIDNTSLAKPQSLRVCTVGLGGGNEIGLRIRYPAP